jgi:hypothetical protein
VAFINWVGWFMGPLLLGLVSVPSQADSIGDCLGCHRDPQFATYTPDGKVVSLYVDRDRYEKSVHARELCTSCHANYKAGAHGGMMVPVEIPKQEMAKVADLRAQDKVAVLECMRCHEKEAARYRASIHGSQALAGNPDAPHCVTCHGSHYTLAVADIESGVSRANVPRTCAQCHQNARVMARYDIATNTVVAYEESFHGKKLKLGSTTVAVCTSCHGVHGIFPPNDPRSTLYPENRPHTCGRCHAHADRWFGQDFAHKIPSPRVQPLAFWVGVAYKWLIYLTIGAMACYVLLDFSRTVADRWLASRFRARRR